jgi:hypothetical protein
MDACPKCGKPTEPGAQICAGCGVIMAKVRARIVPASPASPPTPPLFRVPEETTHASGGLALLKVGVAAAAALAGAFFLWRATPTPGPESTNANVAVPSLAASPTAGPEWDQGAQATVSAEDVKFLNDLSARLRLPGGAGPAAAEIERVEKIAAANPSTPEASAFLMGVYLRAADQALRLGSFDVVETFLAKMQRLDPQNLETCVFEARARATQQDWPGTLAAVERYEALQGPITINASFTKAIALEKVGRRPDAIAVLDRPVFAACEQNPADPENGACASARQMRQALTASALGPRTGPEGSEGRTRAALVVDASKDQIESERFDIRFDGENQSGVARDVRSVLDRAYARLADIYYERPSRKIPVVLHSSRDYYTATGAPWWSGGVYSSHDGAIQIPVRGLPSSLPREMEDVLVHELSHAFVDEMSGGRAGRDLQEGLAQYMEGKRIEEALEPAELKRLATSGQQTVMNFYMLSLVVSQQLVQSRGQGQVNDLLRAMKEAGSEEAGYQKVFGRSGAAIKRDILETFWRRYS